MDYRRKDTRFFGAVPKRASTSYVHHATTLVVTLAVNVVAVADASRIAVTRPACMTDSIANQPSHHDMMVYATRAECSLYTARRVLLSSDPRAEIGRVRGRHLQKRLRAALPKVLSAKADGAAA